MALYGREELEAELAEIQQLESRCNTLLLEKQINGFEYTDFRNKLEAREVKAKGRFGATVATLGLRDRERKQAGRTTTTFAEDGTAKTAYKGTSRKNLTLQNLRAAL
jgi:hypothetical protein